MKKIVALISAVALSISSLSALNVNADDDTEYPVSDPIVEEYQYTSRATSIISTSGTKAHCVSSCTGITGVYKISGAQFLEKKVLLAWVPVEDWGAITYSNRLDMDNSKSGLASGTYRLRTSFIVYYGNTSETITATSTSDTI